MENDKAKFKEDFIKRLIKFSTLIIHLGDKLRDYKLSWSIIDQLIRSSTSVGANIVEAKSSSSRKDYTHFFEIALKSANETEYWLILVQEAVPALKEEIRAALQELREISKIIASSILTLKGKK